MKNDSPNAPPSVDTMFHKMSPEDQRALVANERAVVTDAMVERFLSDWGLATGKFVNVGFRVSGRVIPGDSFRVDPSGLIELVSADGSTTISATEDQVRELHEAIRSGQVQVVVQPRWSSSMGDSQRVVRTLHTAKGIFKPFDAIQFEIPSRGSESGVKIQGSEVGPTPSVAQLQARLAAIEDQFAPLRKQKLVSGPQWDAVSKEAGAVRMQLFKLTGDYYGKPKVKISKPSDDALEAEYLSPEDVPVEVRSWIQKHASIITSDATDAVRWGRICDTLDDDRYPSGDLTIFRAVSAGDEIRPGDWVTTDRGYAEDHLDRYLKGNGAILEETVDGRDVLTSPTGNDEEAIFAPLHLSGPLSKDSTVPVEVNATVGRDDWARALPRAVVEVDGRLVRDHVPNRSSIEASISNSEVLSGVRVIPISAFDYTPGEPDQRTLSLAAQITESGELNPLIVGVDVKGPYIIEGGHRLDALIHLKARELPALVALDLVEFSNELINSLRTSGTADSANPEHGAPGLAGKIVRPSSELLFHVTPSVNLPSIMAAGLTPSRGQRSIDANELDPRVYFFSSAEALEEGLGNWLGDQFGEEEELAIVAVRREDVEALESSDTAAYEASTSCAVPASRIIVVSDNDLEIVDFSALIDLAVSKSSLEDVHFQNADRSSHQEGDSRLTESQRLDKVAAEVRFTKIAGLIDSSAENQKTTEIAAVPLEMLRAQPTRTRAKP